LHFNGHINISNRTYALLLTHILSAQIFQVGVNQQLAKHVAVNARFACWCCCEISPSCTWQL